MGSLLGIGIVVFFSCENDSRTLIADKDNAPMNDEDDLLSDTDEILGEGVTTDTDGDHNGKDTSVDNDTGGGEDAMPPADDDTPQLDDIVPDESPIDNDIGIPDSDSAGSCGDGVVSGPEVCDDGEANGTYGHCKSDCTGLGPHCGDGIYDVGYEKCDDGIYNDTYGHCNSSCTGEFAYCGDGIVDAGYEVCDDGELNGTYNHCRSNCAGMGPYCGDGTIDAPNEVCDDGAGNGAYNHCNTECTGPGPHCGDGIVDAENGEECDKSKDQYCTIGGSGCDPTTQYRLRTCNNATCLWGPWSGCEHDPGGVNPENTGPCANTNC